MTVSKTAPAFTQKTTALHRRVASWFAENARDLPWRAQPPNPWGILVSEIMLQQTPVSRVQPVWERWLDLWPEPAALATAQVSDVLREWGRLGYPRRALRLQQAAQRIVESHQGKVPSSYTELLELPGIGEYTAAAVSAFAFGNRENVIDTNIRRVHARLFSGYQYASPSLTAVERKLSATLLPENPLSSVAWNAGVMELGALLCTSQSPQCTACPVVTECAWQTAGKPTMERPAKTQAWHGTDRQVRGALLAVLRESVRPVPAELLEINDNGKHPLKASATSPTATFAHLTSLHRLNQLSATTKQRTSCLASLVADGLAARDGNQVGLPGTL